MIASITVVSLSAGSKNHFASFHDLQASHSAKWGYKRVNVDRSTAASLPKTALKAKSAKSRRSSTALRCVIICQSCQPQNGKRGKSSCISLLGFKSLYSHDATPDLYDSQSDAIHVRNGVQAILTQIV